MISQTKYTTPVDKLQDFIPYIDSKHSLNEPTGDFFYSPWKIKKQYENTIWHNALNTLDFHIGEARLISLDPGTNYYVHSDIDDRYHLNINGDFCFLIDIENYQMYPLKQDNVWYKMDAGRLHSAANFGNTPRIQLVVRQLLPTNIIKNKKCVSIKLTKERPDARYLFDQIYSPWLNRNVKQGKINNFIKHQGFHVEFEAEEDIVQSLLDLPDTSFTVEIK